MARIKREGNLTREGLDARTYEPQSGSEKADDKTPGEFSPGGLLDFEGAGPFLLFNGHREKGY
jgi:hypothetical protein